MSLDVDAWLEARLAHAPASLAARMRRAVADSAPGNAGQDDGPSSGSSAPTPALGLAERLGAAAVDCMREALARGDARAGAFELLAADALLTHACEAAAEAEVSEPGAFDVFYDRLGPQALHARLAVQP